MANSVHSSTKQEVKANCFYSDAKKSFGETGSGYLDEPCSGLLYRSLAVAICLLLVLEHVL